MADDIAQKITAMTPLTSGAPDDLLVVVDDPDAVGKKTRKLGFGTFLKTYNRSPAEAAAGLSNDDLDFKENTKNVLRYGTNSNPGTTDLVTAFQNSINVTEIDGGFVDARDITAAALGAVLTIDSLGVVIVGSGGHGGGTILTATHTLGPLLRIKRRSCGIIHCRLDSDATRYAATVTDGHGVHVEATDEASPNSLSRNQFFDLDIRRQPLDGYHNAGPAELIFFHTVTCSDNKSHGAVFDDGTRSGRTNKPEAPFNFVLEGYRGIENGGNGLLIGDSSETTQCANIMLINCEGLGNCWDSLVRESLFQFDIHARDVIMLNPDLEDQQYAQTTTATTGETRTALSVPGKGIICRANGFNIKMPHGSSLTSLVEMDATVKGIEVYKPFTAAGQFGTDKAETITGATQANPCVLTVTGTSFVNGDNIHITSVVGMVELNNTSFQIANQATNTVELVDPYSGENVDSTGFTAYTSAGTATPVMDDAVIVGSGVTDFEYTGITSHNTGSGNLVKNQSTSAQINIDGKTHIGLSGTVGDFEIGADGAEILTIVAAVLPQLQADYITVASQSGTTDSFGLIKFSGARDGAEVTLQADAGDTITCTDATATSGDNKGMQLGASRVLVGNDGDMLKLKYNSTGDVFVEIAFLEP